MSRAFNTVPNESEKRKTRRKTNELKQQVMESFDPQPVLNFLTHLDGDLSHYTVHAQIAQRLRLSVEDEVQKLPSNSRVLLDLLTSAWKVQAHSIPDLRPVLIAVLKRLGSQNTPKALLRSLAQRDAQSNTLKYGELLPYLGSSMQRAVYEADFELSASSVFEKPLSAIAFAAKQSTKQNKVPLISYLIEPAVDEYCNDEALRRDADLAFVGTSRERRVATQVRRAGSKAAMGVVGSNNKTVAASGVDVEPKDTGLALTKIKEIIGENYALLGGVLGLMIAMHGKLAATSSRKQGDYEPPVRTVTGGARYLHCCLAADILVSFGQLPKAYEHVGILAKVLDKCVKEGNISDAAVAQVQGCLRSIFQIHQTGGADRALNGISELSPVSHGNNDGNDREETASTPKKKISISKEDREFGSKLMKRVLGAAVAAMRTSDTQQVFLNPVSDAIAPGYSRVIKKPMCMLTIERKIDQSQYATIEEFNKDVQLMFNNCITFNIGQDGTWFRTEARRQNKIFKGTILPQAQSILKNETIKRRKKLGKEVEEDEAPAEITKKKRKRTALSFVDKAKADAAKSKMKLKKHEAVGISSLTADNVEPLASSQSKRRKKNVEIPSIPSLALMLIADPFVTRLLLDKCLNTINSGIIPDKKLPAEHRSLPSILQLLHLTQYSADICAVKGGEFHIPGPGFKSTTSSANDVMKADNIAYASLRCYTPLIGKIMLDIKVDRRMSVGGDLYDVAVQTKLDRKPTIANEWEDTASLCVVRALIEGVLVDLLRPGRSSEQSFAMQFSRLEIVLETFGTASIMHDRACWTSVTQALLSHKAKLASGIRDVVIQTWIKWLKQTTNFAQMKDGYASNLSSMNSALHEIFIFLLNEWASLGNVVMPVDNRLSLSKDAAEAVSLCCGIDTGTKFAPFAQAWHLSKQEKGNCAFTAIRKEYEKMLHDVPSDRATQWKVAVGVDDDSLSKLDSNLGGEYKDESVA